MIEHLTVIDVKFVTGGPNVTNKKPYEYTTDFAVDVFFADEKKTRYKMRCMIYAGFKLDGASRPGFFGCLVKNWSKKNALYNVGTTLHDAFYIHQGFGVFSREAVDDLLVQIWKMSGEINAFVGFFVDKGIQLFAGGPEHWGNDDYEVFDKVNICVGEL